MSAEKKKKYDPKKRSAKREASTTDEMSEREIADAFREAAKMNNVEYLTQLLQEKGVSWIRERDRDPDGWTAAHYAAFNGALEVLKALQKFGLCIDTKSTREHFEFPMSVTPLMVAIVSKKVIAGGGRGKGTEQKEAVRMECVKFLLSVLDFRAIMARDSQGKTALDYAKRRAPIKAAIEEKLADMKSKEKGKDKRTPRKDKKDQEAPEKDSKSDSVKRKLESTEDDLPDKKQRLELGVKGLVKGAPITALLIDLEEIDQRLRELKKVDPIIRFVKAASPGVEDAALVPKILMAGDMKINTVGDLINANRERLKTANLPPVWRERIFEFLDHVAKEIV